MNATNVVTGTVKLLGRTVADIEAALDTTSPGTDGLIFLPFLNGERTPDLPSARGSLHGVSATNFTPEHVIRAAVEGVTFGILNGLDLVLAGKGAKVIQVIGGGARSRAWRQLLADATGALIQVPAEEESGCLGAAIQAIVASSPHGATTFTEATDRIVGIDESATCHPRPELRAAYDRARNAYRTQLQRMYPID
jgi:xylulokinase